MRLPGRRRENSGLFRSSACGPGCRSAYRSAFRPKSGVLRGHRVLVDLSPDLLAQEAFAPSPRDETRLDFAHRNVSARRGLLLRLVVPLRAETFFAGQARFAGGGMGTG